MIKLRIKLSDDKELVNQIRTKLKERNGLCPNKKEDIIENHCICKEFLEQNNGVCRCGLYIKIEK